MMCVRACRDAVSAILFKSLGGAEGAVERKALLRWLNDDPVISTALSEGVRC